MCRECGASRGALGDLKAGRKQFLSADTLKKIADYFAVSIDSLLSGEEAHPLPSNVRPIHVKRFPMLGEISCGTPIFAEEDHETYIDASADIHADFCLTAKGESMIGARIHDGDVVFIKSMPMVENGQIAAVIIDDEATLKRWYYYPEKQKLILTPENPAFEPLVFVGDELDSVRCLGLAVTFMSKL
jgi:repressor LexA